MSSKIIPLQFSIVINAPIETVWHKMLDLENYRIWTTAFDPTSSYQGSWELGQKIVFKPEDQESALIGLITKNEPFKVVEITYQGMLDSKGGDDTSPDAVAMKGLVERYTFTSINQNQTKVDTYTETLDSFSDYMAEQWPVALEKLKDICE